DGRTSQDPRIDPHADPHQAWPCRPAPRPPAEAAPAAPRSALWLALALVACAIGAATTLLSVNLNRDADGALFQAPSLLQLRALFGDGEG
ncbi:MAG: hypothetical protein HC824_18270, partial [Synechococcales cyanobacterium RM1_1_8]|nr:hypothetical protein [Synechococcales cyanobacterium RM1_1_8]